MTGNRGRGDDRPSEGAWPGFTPAEVEYISGRETARLATLDSLGRPHVVPVGYHYDRASGRLVVGGPHHTHTAKYRHVAAGRTAVALTIDDRLPAGQPRGVAIHGVAQHLDEGGRLIHPGFQDAAIWIAPTYARSWRVNDDAPMRHHPEGESASSVS